EGEVTKIAIWVLDNTHQVSTRKKIEESDKRFRDTVKQAPVGITILRGENHMVEMANEAYLKLVGKEEKTFIGRPLFDSLPEVEETVSGLLKGVLETGIPYHGNEAPIPLNRTGKVEIFYFDFLYYPLKEEDGKISGIIVTATEVTEKVEARKRIEQNEERLNIVVEASELGTWELNIKTKEAIYSQRYLQIIGGYKTDLTLNHEQLLKHVHPDDMHLRTKALKNAFETGYLNYEARMIWLDQSVHWMESKGKVFYDENNNPEKLIGTTRDTTLEKKHQQELEESEKRFRNLVMYSPVPKAILKGKDMIIEIANDVLLKNIWKKNESEVQNKRIFDIFPELEQQKYAHLLNEVYTKGEVHSESESLIFIDGKNGGREMYIDFEYAPMREKDDTISGIKMTIIDVTEKVLARKKIEESEKKFRSLTESIPQLIWETDEKGNALFTSGKWLEYTGVHPKGEAEWKAMIHPDDYEENVKTWANSLATGEIYRCDVRVKSKDGNYRWHAVIGEPVFDEENKIIKWVGAFTDIQTEKYNITQLLLSNLGWFSNNAGTYEKLTGTFTLVEKQGGFSQVNGTAIGFDVSGNPAITGDAVMESVVFTGSNTAGYVKPYTTGTYTGYNFNNNWNVRSAGIPTEADAVAVGDFAMDYAVGSGIGVAFNNSNPSNIVKVGTGTPSTTYSNLFRFITDSPNRLKYVGKKKRIFQVGGSISFQVPAAGTYIIYIAKNGTALTQYKIYGRGQATNDIVVLPLNASVELTTNDYIEVFAQRYTGGTNNDIVVPNMTITIK
ncbi:PAS domain-containing protein, partial [Flavobacterium sp. LBUM151]